MNECFCFFFSYIPRSRIAGWKGSSSFLRNLHILFSTVLYTTVYNLLPFLSFVTCICCVPSDDGPPDRCEMRSHHDFPLRFLVRGVERLFMTVPPYLEPATVQGLDGCMATMLTSPILDTTDRVSQLGGIKMIVGQRAVWFMDLCCKLWDYKWCR